MNTSAVFYDFNDTLDYSHYYFTNESSITEEEYLAYQKMIQERKNFKYVYHAFAAFIVLMNGSLVAAILLSAKQRRHFRNWLIIHMTGIHILFGGIALPFLAQSFDATSAGIRSVPLCKLFSFVSDITEYMSNISIGILGVYQCLNIISPRLLKSVSNALLLSIMIILPWFVCVMLTAVLRLTMSEEQWGQCYIVSDKTAQILWLVLARCLPLLMVLTCFISILSVAISPFSTKSDRSPPGRHNTTIFVSICLGACLFMRTPFYIIFFEPIDEDCKRKHRFLCARLTHGLDIVRLLSMLLIPFAYLVQFDIRKRCRKFRSKLLCKTVDCNTTSKKQQPMEMGVKELD
ncbi:uncharacterized protein LOC132727778 isoform X2 [Ruditapes philippinarum]|uniref:uncharacterized protein LOC132727778 isoform X2 n=1 Tax=Ruditapes philippinarum TaxID=129788 RepID=UPI00295B884A|nr:uncharacterized protein LOC132727778 isoform X2 [Ruditapes philippinarum]